MKRTLFTLLIALFVLSTTAQTDEELEAMANEVVYAKNTFYSTRIVNSHSVDMVPKGVLEFRISHRFGELQNGAYDLFGLDVATMRLGFDYGITDKLTLGIGRSTIEKTYDGFAKYEILKQSSGGEKDVFVSLDFVTGMSVRTQDWQDARYDNYYTNRLSYFNQILVARQFSKKTSVQLMPTMVHRNLVDNLNESNDVYALGAALHQQLLPALVVNVEYFQVFPNQIDDQYRNSLSVGFAFNTGWHSFSLHLSNSRSMYERGFITETSSRWDKSQIRIGFNITREFHLVEDW